MKAKRFPHHGGKQKKSVTWFHERANDIDTVSEGECRVQQAVSVAPELLRSQALDQTPNEILPPSSNNNNSAYQSPIVLIISCHVEKSVSWRDTDAWKKCRNVPAP